MGQRTEHPERGGFLDVIENGKFGQRRWFQLV
jgi:hypothetical protein